MTKDINNENKNYRDTSDNSGGIPRLRTSIVERKGMMKIRVYPAYYAGKADIDQMQGYQSLAEVSPNALTRFSLAHGYLISPRDFKS